MPGLENLHSIDFNIDSISQKVQKLREKRTSALDVAAGVVEDNSGRAQAGEAAVSLRSLSNDIATQGLGLHHLDPAHVADLISDPFED
ncbi:hypothetical protein [Pseudodesulfovibrio sp.]|uniref:hypothetical protein n=1 Tax=unclassified Pseudodesulfovibrio TaxID=2661612 RepID=UPI003AFFC791